MALHWDKLHCVMKVNMAVLLAACSCAPLDLWVLVPAPLLVAV